MSNNIHDMRQAYEARITTLESERAALVQSNDGYADLYSTLIDVLKSAGIEPQTENDPAPLVDYVIAAAGRIAALEAALRDARREAMHIIGTYPVRKIIEEALDNTHAAKSE